MKFIQKIDNLIVNRLFELFLINIDTSNVINKNMFIAKIAIFQITFCYIPIPFLLLILFKTNFNQIILFGIGGYFIVFLICHRIYISFLGGKIQ